MRQVLLILIVFSFFSCNNSSESNKVLLNRIEALENKLADAYKPGFGDFMGTLQNHHAKLWFAGENENWKLADFEIHEIEETMEDLMKYQADREESKMIEILNPAIESIEDAIEKKDLELFKRSYILLTNACNKCHQATGYEFNRVKVPEISNFSNQDFSTLEYK
ncbi:hypothetical protein DFR65_10770 [Oceanihabitans sediminis]|uniref:Cytochrome c domain-containing protein n=1 Tax=Oceanihabitans sediminis TaxID=1812012 RepID=A0A368P303_9FLAO|nr:hypothetical protein DFR65_10770 [Oceanihabitans sediminis]RCU56650.1 hypothetical protein DU428_12215 [Oceanihabitans sediminis]